MTYKIKTIKKYLNERNGVTWNTLYKNYGTKKVNKAIESGKVYSSMDGKPRYLGA